MGGFAIWQPLDRGFRIDDPRPGGKPDPNQVLSIPEQAFRGGVLELVHAVVRGHQCRPSDGVRAGFAENRQVRAGGGWRRVAHGCRKV